MNTINLTAIKENGIFVEVLETGGYLYQLNDRLFKIGSFGFIEL